METRSLVCFLLVLAILIVLKAFLPSFFTGVQVQKTDPVVSQGAGVPKASNTSLESSVGMALTFLGGGATFFTELRQHGIGLLVGTKTE